MGRVWFGCRWCINIKKLAKEAPKIIILLNGMAYSVVIRFISINTGTKTPPPPIPLNRLMVHFFQHTTSSSQCTTNDTNLTKNLQHTINIQWLPLYHKWSRETNSSFDMLAMCCLVKRAHASKQNWNVKCRIQNQFYRAHMFAHCKWVICHKCVWRGNNWHPNAQ